MNLVGNGVGRQDRLVLLGPFRAHEMFEVSFPQHHPGPQDHLFRLGVEPEIASQAFPGRVGLERFAFGLPPSSAGGPVGTTKTKARARLAYMIYSVCLGVEILQAIPHVASRKSTAMIKQVTAAAAGMVRR